jgi:hypothetical protein
VDKTHDQAVNIFRTIDGDCHLIVEPDAERILLSVRLKLIIRLIFTLFQQPSHLIPSERGHTPLPNLTVQGTPLPASKSPSLITQSSSTNSPMPQSPPISHHSTAVSHQSTAVSNLSTAVSNPSLAVSHSPKLNHHSPVRDVPKKVIL